METITPDAPAESSPAVEVPRDPQAYAKWRQTGEISATKPKTEASATSTETSSAGKPAEKAAPASEAGKQTQEKKPQQQRSSAETRLNELLDDLKRAGMSPAELKTFKREQKAEQTAETQKASTEQTENPAELKPPTKPNQNDFKTYDEYDAAKDKYYEDLADYKAAKRIEEYQHQQRQNAAQASVHEKMTEAKGRYGDEAIGIISSTARAFTGDQQIPQAVKAILNDSPVWTDLLFTLGSKPDELSGFIELAKTNPGAAIRKAVLLERLITEELAKGTKKPDAGDEGTAAQRGEDGKFTKATPEKKESAAPPPPKEVSGRGTPPPDEVDSAVKNGDTRAYMRAQNARDLARRRG